MARKKNNRVSPDDNQLIFLLMYMEAHLFFAREQVTKLGKNGYIKFKVMWKKLSKKLNKIGVAKKDNVGWRNAWKNIKTKCRQKKINYVRSFNKTGNTKINAKLDNFSERVCDIYGHHSLGLNLNFEIGLNPTFNKMGREKKKGNKSDKSAEKDKKKVENNMRRLINQPLPSQKGIIHDYMMKNPKFAKRTLSAQEMKAHWKILKKLLNAAGPKRLLAKWKKTWSDKKKNLLAKLSLQQAFANQEDEDLAHLLYDTDVNKKTEPKQVKKRKSNIDTTVTKKVKLDIPSTTTEDIDLQEAIHQSAVQFAVDKLRAQGVNTENAEDVQKIITPDLLSAIMNNANLQPLKSQNKQTLNSAKQLDPQPSTSRGNAFSAAGPSSSSSNTDKQASTSHQARNYTKTTKTNNDSESGDSSESDEDSDDNEDGGTESSATTSSDEEERYDVGQTNNVDSSNVFLHILAQQREYNAKTLEMLKEIFEWVKQVVVPPPPPTPTSTVLQDLRQVMEGIHVQLANYTVQEVAPPPEGAYMIGVEGVGEEGGNFVDEDPNSLEKYLPDNE